MGLKPEAMTAGRRTSHALLIAMAAAIIVIVIAGPGLPILSGAADTAEEYLHAACDESGDRGWNLLVADQRTARYGNKEQYLAMADASDCGRFRWRVVHTSCDDGACVMWLSVPDAEAIPAFLAYGPVTYREEKVPPGANAAMAVVRHWPFRQGVVVGDAVAGRPSTTRPPTRPR